MIERHYSLSKAATLLGVNRHTLRRWLEVDLGLSFPDVRQGSMMLISESTVQAVIRKHSPKVDWKLLRRSSPQSAA
jgi:transposase-like protein